MKRRDFLSSALVGGAALAACGGPGASAGEGGSPAVSTGKRIRWRLASSFPRSLDTLYGTCEVMAERVKAMTDGLFDIRCYPAGELVPGLQVLDAAQQGTVQVGQSASYYYIGKNPALAFDTCVPFGLTARQQNAWLMEAGGQALMQELLNDFGVIGVPGGNTGVQMGGWFVPEVNSVEDLKGLKIRIPGLGGSVMQALGAVPQTLAGGEIFPALERKTIDATDWVGPYDDEKLGFHKVAKNYYYPGWWEPGPNLSFYINQKAYAELPASYKEILRTACLEAGMVMQARYDAQNPAALARLLEAGVITRPFSNDLMLAAQEASQQMLVDHAAKDAAYRKVYDHWSTFQKANFQWFGLAERAYANFSFR